MFWLANNLTCTDCTVGNSTADYQDDQMIRHAWEDDNGQSSTRLPRRFPSRHNTRMQNAHVAE